MPTILAGEWYHPYRCRKVSFGIDQEMLDGDGSRHDYAVPELRSLLDFRRAAGGIIRLIGTGGSIIIFRPCVDWRPFVEPAKFSD